MSFLIGAVQVSVGVLIAECVKVACDLIKRGLKTIEDVPERWREKDNKR